MTNLQVSLFNKWIYLHAVLMLILQVPILIQAQAADNCNHGDVRLVGTRSTNLQGRVDVCYQGVWGQICGLRWDDNEAQVVCRQLGLNPNDAQGSVGNLYGTASGPHFFTEPLCTGTEMNLLDCVATRLENTSSCPDHLTTQVMCQELESSVVLTSTVENLISRTTTITTTTNTFTPITPMTSSSMPSLPRDSTTASLTESPSTNSVTPLSTNSVTDILTTDSHITSTTELFEPEPANNTTMLIIIFGTICGVVILMLVVILIMLAVIVAKRRGFKIRRRKAVFKTSHQRSIDNTYKPHQYGTENGRTLDNQLYIHGKKPVATVENSSYETITQPSTTSNEVNQEYSDLTEEQHVYSEIAPPSHVYAQPRGKPQPYSVPVIEVKHLRTNGKAVTDTQGYATLTNDVRPYEVPQFVQQTTEQSQSQTGSEDEFHQTFETGKLELESDLDKHNT